jgi:hypothetical protein
MKRQLTKQEKEMTNKVIIKQEETLKDLKEALEMKKILVDKILPYNRRMEDKHNNQELDILQEKIKETRWAIDSAKEQLLHGVESKKVAGVE